MRNASMWGFSFQCECVGVGPLATHILAFGKWPRPKRPRAPTTWQLMGVRLVSPTDWLFDWRTDGWSKAFECALLHWEKFQNYIHIRSIHFCKTCGWDFSSSYKYSRNRRSVRIFQTIYNYTTMFQTLL